MSFTTYSHLNPGYVQLTCLLTICMLVACAEKKNKSSPASIASSAPSLPQFPIRSLAHSTSDTISSGNLIGDEKWGIHIAQFPDDQISQLGFEDLFRTASEPDRELQNRITNHSFMNLAQSKTNVVLAFTISSYAGVCSSETYRSAVQKFQNTANVEFLTTPPATTIGTNEAQVVLQDTMNIVLPSSGLKQKPQMVALSFGQHLSLDAYAASENKIGLKVVYCGTEFNGYHAPAGIPKGMLNPYLQLTFASGIGDIAPGETLLLGTGKLVKVRTVVQLVPYLSAIPVIGDLFEKRSRQTNYLRQVVMIRRIAE